MMLSLASADYPLINATLSSSIKLFIYIPRKLIHQTIHYTLTSKTVNDGHELLCVRVCVCVCVCVCVRACACVRALHRLQYFHSNNTWIDRGQVDVLIDSGIFVAMYKIFSRGSLLMHTDSHEHKLTPQTFERICESMPHMPTKRPEFCIGD